MSDYLSTLPADLSHHLAQAGWLEDWEVVQWATSNHTHFNTINTRYERTTVLHWYLYRVEDVQQHFNLPWSDLSNKESEPYLLTSTFDPRPPSITTGLIVILNHRIEDGILNGWQSLPLNSFVTKIYQRRPYQIGHIAHLHLSTLPAPESHHGGYRDGEIYLTDLSFVPFKTVKHLALDNGLIHRLQSIATPSNETWPTTKLVTLKLYSAVPSAVFTNEMMPHWPSSLVNLDLKLDYISGRSQLLEKFLNSEPLPTLFFPKDLQTLTIHDSMFDFKKPELVHLPPNLTKLICSPKHPLGDWQLPVTLEHLECYNFNESVDGWRLPPALKRLEFGDNFNKPISKMIFNDKLTHLSFASFNQPLIGVSLPASLETIEVGTEFEQTLLGVSLPPNLKMLDYGVMSDPSVHEPVYFTSLPLSLTRLFLGNVWLTEDEEVNEQEDAGAGGHSSLKLTAISNLPLNVLINLDHLSIPLHLLMKVQLLPPVLRVLWVHCDATLDLHVRLNFSTLNRILATTANLKELNFDTAAESLDGFIVPHTLEELGFGLTMNATLDKVVFDAPLKCLSFGDEFNQSLADVTLPPSLTLLRLGHSFNQSMDGVKLPTGLVALHIDPESDFNQPLKNLPVNLKSLTLPCCYDTSFVLPQGLEQFAIGDIERSSTCTYLESLIRLNLPLTLRLLTLPDPLTNVNQAHPVLDDYRTWLKSLSLTHPYLRIHFSHPCESYDEDEDEDEDAVDDDGEDVDEDGSGPDGEQEEYEDYDEPDEQGEDNDDDDDHLDFIHGHAGGEDEDEEDD